MTDVKYMDVKQFRELGYLQEANRRFFHPLGLALEIVQDADGNERLGGIWDYRDDPEGVIFDESYIDREKADQIQDIIAQRYPDRVTLLGYWTQPVK